MSPASSGRDRLRRGGRDWSAGLQWVLDSHLQRLLGRARDTGGPGGERRPTRDSTPGGGSRPGGGSGSGDIGAAGRPSLRVSDSDRDRVAEALHGAAVEGRLAPAELAERLERVWSARTVADLAPVLVDLPVEPGLLPEGDESPTAVSAYFRTVRRDGPWEVPPHLPVVVSCGAVALDLTRARVRTPEVVLDLAVTLGTVEITVPAGVSVVIKEGLAVFGRWPRRTRAGAQPGTVPPAGRPVVRITGTVVAGRITVKVARAARDRRPSG